MSEPGADPREGAGVLGLSNARNFFYPGSLLNVLRGKWHFPFFVLILTKLGLPIGTYSAKRKKKHSSSCAVAKVDGGRESVS